MTEKKLTPIRKGTVVRNTTTELLGRTYLVERVRRVRDSEKLTVDVKALDSGVQIKAMPMESVKAMADCTPAEIRTMDAAVAQRKVEEEERRVAHEAAEKAKREKARLKFEREEMIWDTATPYNEPRSAPGAETFRSNIIVMGPKWRRTDKQGKEISGQDYMSIDITVEREWGNKDTVLRNINWPSWGRRSPAQARAMAKALTLAADVADEVVLPEAKSDAV